MQVVYNLFDQSPADVLFPACERQKVGVIARVPFDEGSLAGTLTSASAWPAGDFRNLYFAPPQLEDTLALVAPLQAVVESWGISLPSVALRFILSHLSVTTVIPGMRKPTHVKANLGVSDAGGLTPAQVQALGQFRWVR